MGLRDSVRERRKGAARDTDMYEGTYARLEQVRQARSIGDPNENLPAGLKEGRAATRRLSRRSGLIITIIVLALAIITFGSVKQQSPSLSTDCSTPELKLSTTSARSGSNITWSATGPAGRYVLAIDARALDIHGATIGVQKSSGGNGKSATLAGRAFSMSGCAASGRFAFTVPPGDHTLRMFRVAGDSATVVRTQDLTVTDTGL